MLSRGRNLVAPAYLFACLVLGGSAQGIWQNMVLQPAGLAIIGWAALAKRDGSLTPGARQLLLIALCAMAWATLQMVPLPPAIWSHLGPRDSIAGGFGTLGLAVPPEPLSLNPAGGLYSLLSAIPPLAMICAMSRLHAYRPIWLAAALIAGTLAGIVLGALQVASSGTELSPWYLYRDTNGGRGVGFFANVNHMAALLVMTIPFLAAVIAAAKSRSKQRYSAIVVVAAAIAIIVLVGIVLNGSFAGYGLALPVAAASALIFVPSGSRARFWILISAAVLVVGSITALEATPIGSSKLGENASSSVQSRMAILATTSRAAGDFMPFGSGLGSFRKVYALYESPDKVTGTFVIHAHNDYAEIALELGVPGVVLVLLLLAWWAIAVARVWRTAEAGPFARAAAIASAAVLIHTLVDFPLRTAAIAACFGMCLALLADSRSAPPKEGAEMRRTRHLEFR
jgi:O-antigen ligase